MLPSIKKVIIIIIITIIIIIIIIVIIIIIITTSVKRLMSGHQINGGWTVVTSCLKLSLQVRAAYKYVAEDDDELSFEKGEIINVVEFDDPEEQVRCFKY